MNVHGAMSQVIRRSYAGKMFAVAFLGTHIPLLALILWMLLRSDQHDPMLTQVALIALLATLAGTALTLYLLHRLLHPVRASAAALDAYDRDRVLPELPDHGDDEASRLMRGVNRNIRSIDETLGELEHLALHDPLTQALNRRGAEQALAESVRHAREARGPFSLVVVDADNLKPINDEHGHAAGDQALISMVANAQRMLGDGEWIGRWGGDEFLIGLHDEADAAREKLARWMASLGQSQFPLHASAGISVLRPGQSAQALYRIADAAMYRAKHEGGQRIISADV